MNHLILPGHFTPALTQEIANLIRRLRAREAELRAIRNRWDGATVWRNDILADFKAKQHEIDLASDRVKDWLLQYAGTNLVRCDGSVWYVSQGCVMAVQADGMIDVSDAKQEG